MANETIMQGLLDSLMKRPEDATQQRGALLANIMNTANPLAATVASMLPGQMANVNQAARGLFGLPQQQSFQQLVASNPEMTSTSQGLLQLAKLMQAQGDPQRAAELVLMAQQKAQSEKEAALELRKTEADIALSQAQAAELVRPAKQNLPSAVQEYAFAQTQGFKGSFEDWRLLGQEKSSPSSVQEYEYAKKQGYSGSLEDWKGLGANKSLTIGSAPAGYMYTGSTDNIKLVPIPGGPADKGMSPTDAAKASLIKTASDNFNELKGMVFNYDDRGAVAGVNLGNIFNSNVPGGGTPFTEGRTLNVLIKDILEGKIRAESGAAVPTAELNRLAERFRPSILDKDSTVERKMMLLGQFLDNANAFMKPDGTFDVSAATLAVDNVLRNGTNMSTYTDEQLMQIMSGQTGGQ